jgi:Ca2+-binding RTX toxin-like protein
MGTGDDTVIGGNFNTDVTITLGNGNDVFKAGNNNTGSNITLGSGTDTIYNGDNNTLATTTVGKGSLSFMMSEVTTRMIPSTSMELLCIMSTAEITTRIIRPFSATTM